MNHKPHLVKPVLLKTKERTIGFERKPVIDTRKIVALIAVIDRMNTTPSPAKNAGTTSGSVTR